MHRHHLGTFLGSLPSNDDSVCSLQGELGRARAESQESPGDERKEDGGRRIKMRWCQILTGLQLCRGMLLELLIKRGKKKSSC